MLPWVLGALLLLAGPLLWARSFGPFGPPWKALSPSVWHRIQRVAADITAPWAAAVLAGWLGWLTGVQRRLEAAGAAPLPPRTWIVGAHLVPFVNAVAPVGVLARLASSARRAGAPWVRAGVAWGIVVAAGPVALLLAFRDTLWLLSRRLDPIQLDRLLEWVALGVALALVVAALLLIDIIARTEVALAQWPVPKRPARPPASPAGALEAALSWALPAAVGSWCAAIQLHRLVAAIRYRGPTALLILALPLLAAGVVSVWLGLSALGRLPALERAHRSSARAGLLSGGLMIALAVLLAVARYAPR